MSKLLNEETEKSKLVRCNDYLTKVQVTFPGIRSWDEMIGFVFDQANAASTQKDLSWWRYNMLRDGCFHLQPHNVVEVTENYKRLPRPDQVRRIQWSQLVAHSVGGPNAGRFGQPVLNPSGICVDFLTGNPRVGAYPGTRSETLYQVYCDSATIVAINHNVLIPIADLSAAGDAAYKPMSKGQAERTAKFYGLIIGKGLSHPLGRAGQVDQCHHQWGCTSRRDVQWRG